MVNPRSGIPPFDLFHKDKKAQFFKDFYGFPSRSTRRVLLTFG